MTMWLITFFLFCLSAQQAFTGLFVLSVDDNKTSIEISDQTNSTVLECSNGSHCDEETLQISYEFASVQREPGGDQLQQLVIKLLKLVRNSPFRVDHLSDFDNFEARNLNKWRALDQDTTLRQVLVIHRHGDRTPTEFSPGDKLAGEPFWSFHGVGQLTNRGKARVNMLGKIMRSRYNKFLAGSVNKNFRKTRSSGALRCIESAQGFLSSFISLDNIENSQDAKSLVWDHGNQLAHLWQPASITTLAAKYDGMLNEGAECKALDDLYTTLDRDPRSIKLLEDYKHEAAVLKEVLDFDIDHFYKWYWAISSLEVERSYFENSVDPRLIKIYNRLEKAGTLSLGILQSPLKLRRLRAGLLIDDMIKNMKDYRDLNSGKREVDPTFVKKFVHYAAHDLNLAVLLGMFNVWDKFPRRPGYAATIMIELHDSGTEWFLRFYYMPHVPMKPVELHLMECEAANEAGRCTLDKFDELMSKYKVSSWQNWMKECGNDLSQVDPYKQNT